jgi:hypothetical protein
MQDNGPQPRFVPTKGMLAYLRFLAAHPVDRPSEILAAVGYSQGARERWRRVPAYKMAETEIRASPEFAAAFLLHYARAEAVSHTLDTMRAGQGRTSVDAANLILREVHARSAARSTSALVDALERLIAGQQPALPPGSDST